MISATTPVQGSHWRTRLTILLSAILANGAHAAPRDAPEPPTYLAPKPVTDPVEMGAWMGRLAGKYTVKGAVMIVYAPRGVPVYPCVTEAGAPTDFCTSIKGKADCVAVGSGPGVQCMFNVSWLDIYEVVQPQPSSGDNVNSDPVGVFSLPGGVSYLDPAMALYGLNPGKSELRYLLVDSKGLPEGGPGSIADDSATFKTACVNEAALFNEMKPVRNREEGQLRDCERTIKITAKAGGKLVQVSIEIEISGEPWTRHDLTLHREN